MTSPAPLKPRTWWIGHGAIVVVVLVLLARYSLKGWNEPPPPEGWISLDFRKFAVVTAALLAMLYVAISTVIAARTRTRLWRRLLVIHVGALPLAVVMWWVFALETRASDKLKRFVPNPYPFDEPRP